MNPENFFFKIDFDQNKVYLKCIYNNHQQSSTIINNHQQCLVHIAQIACAVFAIITQQLNAMENLVCIV
jgi:hypothetical protein